jgi:hypothetical protein
LFINAPAGRGCGSRSPKEKTAPALALSQSNRFVNKPSHFTFGDLQFLEVVFFVREAFPYFHI